MYDLTIPGWMFEEELIQIERWANEVPENGVIMEIGSWYGRSAYAWAKSCHPSVHVYCVDIFYDPLTDTDFHDAFNENTKDAHNITSIVAPCPYFKYSKYVDRATDIFFVDSEHNNPADWAVIEFGMKNLKSGGLLCGHDFMDDWPVVGENIKRLEEMLGKSVTTYPNTTLWSFVVDK